MEPDNLKAEVDDNYLSPDRPDFPESQIENLNEHCDYYRSVSETKRYSLPEALSQHFSVVQELGDGTISGICHSCGATLKFTLRATSNLITHLKRCDVNRYEIYSQSRKCRRMRRGSPTSMEVANTNVPGFDFRSHSLDSTSQSSHKPIMRHFKIVESTPHGKITARCFNCGGHVKASAKATSNLIAHLKRCSASRFERYCRDRGRKKSLNSQFDMARLFAASGLTYHDQPVTAPENASRDHNALIRCQDQTSLTDGSRRVGAGEMARIVASDLPYRDQPLSTPEKTGYDHAVIRCENQPSLNGLRPVAALENSPHAIHSADRASCHQMFGAPFSKQRKMVKSLVLSVASDHVSYEILLKPNLRTFLSSADDSFVMPDANTMNKVIIPLCAQKIEEKIISELQHSTRVYLYSHLWKSAEYVTYVCFHVNFINENWELISRHLGSCASESKLLPPSMLEAIDRVNKKFNIDSKIEKLVVDNSFPLAGNASFLTSRRAVTNMPDSDFPALISFLPETIGSIAERLRFCLAKSLFCDEIRFAPILISIKKATDMTSAVRECAHAFAYLQQQRIEVASPCSFNDFVSLVGCLSAIGDHSAHYQTALSLLEAPLSQSLALSGTEMQILTEIVQIFKPFLAACKYLAEGRLRTIVPVAQNLSRSIDAIEHIQLTHCDVVRSRLTSLLTEHLEPVLSRDEVKTATFLDPRFKLSWLESQDDKDVFLSKVKTRISLHELSKVDSNTNANEGEDAVDGACQYYLSEPLSPMDTDPLLYWKCCPSTLQPLALLARALTPCVMNFSTAETRNINSTVVECYDKFPTSKDFCEQLLVIDRNKDLFNCCL